MLGQLDGSSMQQQQAPNNLLMFLVLGKIVVGDAADAAPTVPSCQTGKERKNRLLGNILTWQL